MWLQKISIPTQRKVIGNSEGKRVTEDQIFKRKYEAKLEFLEGWEGSIQKTFCGGGTVLDRSNLTGNVFLERLGNAKRNA